MDGASLRKGGFTSKEFTGKEGVDAREMGSALASEHKPHVTDDNSTAQDTVSGKVNKGMLGARGVQD